MSVLLDTDVVIEIQRGKNPRISAEWASLIGSGVRIFYNPVVAAEMWAGARPQEHIFLHEFFEALSCLESDYETGKLAGRLMLQYARSHRLEVPDALVAATAIQHRAMLWTRNRKHYPMPELNFYN